MAALIEGEVVPLLVGEQVAVEAIAVVRIAFVVDVFFEMLLVLFVILLPNLRIIHEVLLSLSTGTEDSH